jgi:hypothetical protein
MKKLLLVPLFAFATAACGADTTKPATAPATPAPAAAPAAAPAKTAETRKVCVDVKDKAGKPVLNKDGTVKQKCQTVKVHKKLEGTKVPPK